MSPHNKRQKRAQKGVLAKRIKLMKLTSQDGHDQDQGDYKDWEPNISWHDAELDNESAIEKHQPTKRVKAVRNTVKAKRVADTPVAELDNAVPQHDSNSDDTCPPQNEARYEESEEQEFWEVAGYEPDVSWYDDDLESEQPLFNILDLKDWDWNRIENHLKPRFHVGTSDRTKMRERQKQRQLAEEGKRHPKKLTDFFVRRFSMRFLVSFL
jgi:hypothetical protein